MTNIREGNFLGEQSIEHAQEFICCGDDGFFMFHSLFPFPFVVGAKHIGVEDSARGHLPKCPTQMAVTSFRDSVLTFEFSGFLNDWVNSCAGNDLFMRRNGINSGHFSDEVGGGQFANAWHRSEDIHRFWMMGIYFFKESGFEAGQFFFQFKQPFDTAFQNFFPVIIINADGILCNFCDFVSGEIYFSSSARGNFSDDLGNLFLLQFSGDACGGDFKEEFKHGFGEDVMFMGQFIKDIEGDLFNSVFEFSDFLGDYFVFSAEEFGRIGGGGVFDFLGVFEEEGGDGLCRDFVGGGFSQSSAFFEVFDQKWIEDCDIVALIDKEVEDIEMVTAGRFNADGEVLWVADGLEEGGDFSKSFVCLGEFFLIDNSFLCINNTEVQGIEGCIYADKIFIFRHGVTSFFALGGLNNGNRMLSLPSSIVIRDLRPNQLIGNGESRGQTPSRARSPGLMASPCFQSLNAISSMIITKLYPNST